MPVNFVDCNTPEEFFEFYEKMKDQDEYWLAWFYGGIDQATGQGWCGDCVVAEPFIEKALEEHWGDKTVVKCVVPTRDEWKGVADHPYRTHSQLGLVGIPTLVLFQKDAQLMKVDDDSLQDPDMLEDLLTAYE